MVTEEDNATIERMISEGKSPMAIRAAVPNVSRTNVYLKISKYKKHGTVGRVQTKTLGRPRAMTDGVDKFLQGLLAAKPDMELDEMRRHLQNELQLSVSMSTISRAISRAGIAVGQRSTRPRVKRRRNKVSAVAAAHAAVMEGDATTNTDVSGGDMSVAEADIPAHLGLPWSDLQQQHHHGQHHHDHHLHAHHHHLHALDPSLASAYHPAAVYQDVYSDLPRDPSQHPLAMASPSTLDVYRSPYGPI